MKWKSLPARLLYGAIALPIVSVVVCTVAVWLLPWLQKLYGVPSPPPKSEELFWAGMEIGVIVALPAFLCALTLRWKRRRRRSGRTWRLGASAVIVVVTSLAYAGLGHSLIYDLLFAAWLAYALALTFVRYGLVDRRRRSDRSSSTIAEDAEEDTVE